MNEEFINHWAGRLLTPMAVVTPETVRLNVDRMLEIVGGRPERLRPHMKTHKCREVLEILLERGISRTKCATLAEVELAAFSGVGDILLAKQPSLAEARWLESFAVLNPQCRISFTGDNPDHVANLMREAVTRPGTLGFFLDVDTGLGRTGMAVGECATKLIQDISRNPAFEFCGIHIYDGHINHSGLDERMENFTQAIDPVREWVDSLKALGLDPGEIVAGGSPTFQCVAGLTDWVCSPGTVVYWDRGFQQRFQDYSFEPAVHLITQVISLQEGNRVCLDLGHKAVSAENPIDKRVYFPRFPEAEFIKQNEEHLLMDLKCEHSLKVGDLVVGIPWHICPTVALYNQLIVSDGDSVEHSFRESWEIRARKRIQQII